MRIDDSDTNREKSEAEWGGEVVQAPAAAVSIERHHPRPHAIDPWTQFQ
jgi:hypothetical protein